MFVSPAFAQAAGGGGGSGFEAMLPLVLIFVVFYFLLIRPQQKKMKVHKEMLGSVRRGDRVVTGGGIIGTVIKVDGDELTVEIASGVRVKVARGLISSVIAKSEPVKGAKKSAKAKDKEGDEDAGGSEGDKEAKEGSEEKEGSSATPGKPNGGAPKVPAPEAAKGEGAGAVLRGLFGGGKDKR